MQRAASEVQAANGALAHCKHPPIASLEERRASAIACRTRFADVRDALLREYEWNFATARATLARDATPALGNLRNRYALPDDCVRVRGVAGLETDGWAVEHPAINPGDQTRLSQVLVTNALSPTIEYTRRVEEPALWDALFLKVFQLRLGAAIAPLIARNSGLAVELEAMSNEVLRPTKRADAQEKARQQVSRDTSWLRARRGWR